MLEQQERDFVRLQRQRMSSDDFEPLKLIGRGAFGEVCVGNIELDLHNQSEGLTERGDLRRHLCTHELEGEVLSWVLCRCGCAERSRQARSWPSKS